MRKLCMRIVVALLMCSIAAVADEPRMESFVDSAGHFSVLFPGSPKATTQATQLEGSDSTTIYEFAVSLDDDSVAYLVMYNDYPEKYANGDAQTVLAATRDGALKGKTMTSDGEISLNGVPGRAFTATDKDGFAYTVHQYLSGKRLYQLIVVSNKEHPALQSEQFLNSFKIL